MNYFELSRLMLAEILILVTALVVLGVDLGARNLGDSVRRRRMALGIALAGCLLAVAWLLFAVPEGRWGDGMFVSNALTRLVKGILVVLTAGTLLFRGGCRSPRTWGNMSPSCCSARSA